MSKKLLDDLFSMTAPIGEGEKRPLYVIEEAAVEMRRLHSLLFSGVDGCPYCNEGNPEWWIDMDGHTVTGDCVICPYWTKDEMCVVLMVEKKCPSKEEVENGV